MIETRKRWTRADNAVMRLLWPIADRHMLSAVLGRSLNSIRMQAAKLGLPRSRRYSDWTDVDDRAIHSLYPRLGGALSAKLLNRSASSVYVRAFQLGVKREFGPGVQA